MLSWLFTKHTIKNCHNNILVEICIEEIIIMFDLVSTLDYIIVEANITQFLTAIFIEKF
jgi:hypothetical protein